ncbi:MAG: hypothetical protein ACSHXH_09885 [Marivita sp.]|uniref:hypothetical protein n=1 Tax=Marivita sp. TaxID=2003365 RepID=UPI003EF42DDB
MKAEYMPYTKPAFEADFQKVNSSSGQNTSSDVAWAVYVGALNTPLKMQVFGRHIRGRDGEIIAKSQQGQAGITQDEMKNFKHPESESADSLTGGSILNVPEWSPTINDSWICGGVHSRQPFHAASPLINDNIFERTFVLTVTGRELVGLALAGYRKTGGDPKLGVVFQSTQTAKAEDLTLISYNTKIAELNTEEKARAFLKKNGMI